MFGASKLNALLKRTGHPTPFYLSFSVVFFLLSVRSGIRPADGRRYPLVSIALNQRVSDIVAGDRYIKPIRSKKRIARR